MQGTHAKCFIHINMLSLFNLCTISLRKVLPLPTLPLYHPVWLVGKLRIRGVKNVLEATSPGSKEPHLEFEGLLLTIMNIVC